MSETNTPPFVDVLGTVGEGGGQILRTSLALSVVTGKPFRITNIRAKRKNRGLRPQHLACVRAAAAISGAEVTGDEIGSGEITFTPGPVVAGEYQFDIGTAGSTTLVLQTVLAPLLLASGPSKVTIDGGTHNPMAPPVEFLQTTYLPQLAKMGAVATITVEQTGFYPAGGGRIVAEITPVSAWERYHLLDSGDVSATRATVMLSNLPEHLVTRELALLQKKLALEEGNLHGVLIDGGGTGNVVQVSVEQPEITELFTAFGSKGIAANKVASDALRQVLDYRRAKGAVGTFLADQLLLPLAIGAGGRYRTGRLSSHTHTNIQVIKQFLDIPISSEQIDTHTWDVVVGSETL